MSVTFKPEDLRPSARSYTPGTYPQTFFQSLNGSTTVVQFGARNFDAELTLQFSNIEDTAADTIIGVYEEANGVWDYVDFNNTQAMDAASTGMQSRMKEGSPLKWRFKEPPTVTYKFRNRCDVSCIFTAFLDGV